MAVNPDFAFIREMKAAGGDTLKKCYQCATCSVVCPLSSDENPFPRRQMILAQWGQKEKLIGDPSVFLCHQCGDCTAYCPRGAKPGDTLGAIRAASYKYFGWPAPLAGLAASAKNLWIRIGFPALVIALLWLISGGMHVPDLEHFATIGYTQFFGHWDFRLLSKNIFFIWLFILPSAACATWATYKGVTAMWKAMAARSGIADTRIRTSALQFFNDFVKPALVEVVTHERFKKCTVNKDRLTGHRPLMWAFLALTFVTGYSLFTQDVLGFFIPEMHGPLSMMNPVKMLANVAAVGMIIGTAVLWSNRKKLEAEGQASATFYDWFLLWLIMAVGVTGLVAEVFRLVGFAGLGYGTYYLHLVSVMMLFLYMPYTKFAHLVYRTTAMVFERYRDSL